MKTGRNEPCPCGSGKKFKHCCIRIESSIYEELVDEIEQTTAMNPHLTLEELNTVIQHRTNSRNERPNPDFCGLSSTQMSNWLYSSFDKLELVTISTPEDLSSSPVMRYLSIILEEAMENGGSFKLTQKGNLPKKLVMQASSIFPELPVSKYTRHITMSWFSGNTEDDFNALHYTRIIAEMAGVIYSRNGKIHIKKSLIRAYEKRGVNAFFIPMLEEVVTNYNWGYMDTYSDEINLRFFWLFMIWRLQKHASVTKLTDEVLTAFPMLYAHSFPEHYKSNKDYIYRVIIARFVDRFLQYWGFVVFDPVALFIDHDEKVTAEIQPLFAETFKFSI
jgi:hypothetical protein